MNKDNNYNLIRAKLSAMAFSRVPSGISHQKVLKFSRFSNLPNFMLKVAEAHEERETLGKLLNSSTKWEKYKPKSQNYFTLKEEQCKDLLKDEHDCITGY